MNIFITGAAGYIGGSIAHHLAAQGHALRGLVRKSAQAAALEAWGMTPVLGDLEDSSLLEAEARRSDAVINAASSLHGNAVKALVGGLSGSGKALLHTSGIGLLSDDARGDTLSEQVFTDDEPILPGNHPMQKALRDVERLVIDAAEVGVRSVVLSNSLIYGRGLGLHQESVQLPLMVGQARATGVSCVVGRGVNRWSNVHVEDMAVLYALALEKAPPGAFYFVENGEASFAEIGATIAVRLGLGPVKCCSLEEAAAMWGEIPARYLLGTNSRARAVRARREIGWSPEHGSLTEWIMHEMPVD